VVFFFYKILQSRFPQYLNLVALESDSLPSDKVEWRCRALSFVAIVQVRQIPTYLISH
jgi:hypothetical protein